MYQTKLYPGTYTNSKRALQSRSLPTNAIIGIVFGTIGVIACVLTTLLICHLNKSRTLRCCRRRVDRHRSTFLDTHDTSAPVGFVGRVLSARWRNKLLPRLINVTDSGTVRNEEPQLQDDNTPPNGLPQVRGGDLPFPRTPLSSNQPLSIVTPGSRYEGNHVSSPIFLSEMHNFLDLTSTPTDQPTSSSGSPLVPGPPRRPQPAPSPLTVTASFSPSGVRNGGAVRRPDGPKGKGRKLTVSVIMDDGESSGSGGGAMEHLRHSFHDSRRDTGSNDSEDVLGEVLEHYTGH